MKKFLIDAWSGMTKNEKMFVIAVVVIMAIAAIATLTTK